MKLFLHFKNVSQITVKECILSSTPKSCELDPIPSKLVIECLDSILPSLTDLFNSSLASSHNASNQLLSHILKHIGLVVRMSVSGYRG